jgi:hypothetical protein
MARAPRNDPRKRIGTHGMALAHMIRNNSFANSCYGSLSASKMVNGIVTDVRRDATKPGSKLQKLIVASYDFSNGTIISDMMRERFVPLTVQVLLALLQ